MKYNIPLILFAGGQSSRMGQDKSLLPFASYNSLSEFQYVRLHKLFSDIYISTKEDKFDFKANIILDRYEESSPLIGLISVFETLVADEVFILSVDAPFIDEAIIKVLIQNKEKYETIIAQTKSGKHPLCGIYKRSILPLAKTHLKENDHRMGNLLKAVDTKFVFFEDDSFFTNLNHPHEYKEAVRRIDSSPLSSVP